MFFVNSYPISSPPTVSRLHLLRDLELRSTLTYKEIIDITSSPYSNENWAKLAYFVTKNVLRTFDYECIGRIVEKKIAREEWLLNEKSIYCLYHDTCLRMPGVCDWTRQFLFFTQDNFLGSMGIYALKLSADTSEHLALKQIANAIQHHLACNSPFNRVLLAIQKDNRWELAFAESYSTNLPKEITKSRKVKISIFKKPSKFFDELLSGGKASNIFYEEYEVRVRM